MDHSHSFNAILHVNVRPFAQAGRRKLRWFTSYGIRKYYVNYATSPTNTFPFACHSPWSAFAFQGDLGGTDTVYKVAFIVANSLAGEPIDLTPPYTVDDTGTDPDYDATNSSVVVVSYADEDQRLLDVPWTVQFVGKSNGDNLLEDGEKAEVTVWLLDRDTTKAITATDSVAYMDGTGDGGGTGGIDSSGTLLVKSTRFIVELTPQQGAPLTISRTLPPGLRQVMNLQ